MKRKFSGVPTQDLLQHMRAIAREYRRRHPRQRRAGGCGCARCAHGTRALAFIGAEEPGWIESAMARAEALVQQGQETLARVTDRTVNDGVDRLKRVGMELRDWAAEAYKRNVTDFGDAMKELADRMGDAMYAFFTRGSAGLGEAWRNFWGLGPAELGMLAVGGTLLFALGAGYLLLSPGGQSLLVGAGTAAAGTGKALVRLV